MKSIIIYRPDGLAYSYRQDAASSETSETKLGKVTDIDFAESADHVDFVVITFEHGRKTFGSMPYAYTYFGDDKDGN